MTDIHGSARPLPEPPTGPWTGRVAYRGGEAPYAHRPHEVIVRGNVAADHVAGLADVVETEDDGDGSFRLTLAGDVDIDELVAELRDDGHRAEPNYVLFADGCGCCGPHPSVSLGGIGGDPVHANPVHANPVYANGMFASTVWAGTVWASPVYANPVYANPVYANPVYANGYQQTGERMSSARPAAGVPSPLAAGSSSAKVIVLDTGLAVDDQVPPLLDRLKATTLPVDRDRPDVDGNGVLDPVAGHGTFIAGLLALLAPEAQIAVGRVLSTFGDGDEWTIGRHLAALRADGLGGLTLDAATVVSLSFSGYAPEEMWYLARQTRKVRMRGAVVVASAGNDATCRRAYPAALPGVIGVGALGPTGPAPFTNHGPWVRASAPGVDLVSAFFKDFNGPLPSTGSTDPDNFTGWARWSGTSFAGPVVAAALAREIRRLSPLNGAPAPASAAVASVVDAPSLLRLPGLGTVVNLA